MNPFNIKVLKYKGNALEIGRQHGEDFKKTILYHAEAVEKNVRRIYNLSKEDYYELIFDKTSFFQAAQKYTPHVIDEIRGIADAVDLDFRAIFINQLLDESGWMVKKIHGQKSVVDESHCSVIGAYGKMADPSVIAQNADMGKSVDGYQILVIQENTQLKMKTMLLTLPGLIGIYGMNQESIGVCLNAMSGRMHKSLTGLGTLFVARGVLAAKKYEDAVNFLKSVPHASGETYTVGGKKEVGSFECSANAVAQFVPFDDAQYVYHTNHALVNDDIEITPAVLKKQSEEYRSIFHRGIKNSSSRLESLKSNLESMQGALDRDKCIEILSAKDDIDNPVCRHKQETTESMTNFSMVMEFSDSPVLHAAGGPPCMSEFRSFSFD
jgi:hypothetical protein